MKFYDCNAAANPRSVRMALAEKAIEVESVQVDLFKGEQLGAAYRRINPMGTVPCLQLDDGLVISESIAIVRYLEAQQPTPCLLGSAPKEQALVAMWQRRMEDGVLNAATTFFHHATPGLGDSGRYRNADWGEANRRRFIDSLGMIDRELSSRGYVAGDAFSFADITAFCGIGFAKAVGIALPEGHRHLDDWQARIAARPSAAA